ncbi:MAG: hypothetical protein EBT79_14835, partial [Actinobacteria bacterium]|nr:hypothetical protein [Actinomycetota bacterium]
LANHFTDDAARSDDDILFGTVDSWLAWKLSGGESHVIDHTNAAVTGLTVASGVSWNQPVLDALGVHLHQLPRIVPTSGHAAIASGLPGSPPITALVGDQQASLVGQGCITTGATKITFGTGGMLDMFVGTVPPANARRNAGGTFPIVAFSGTDGHFYGVEGIMLSAGTNVEWLRDDMGLISTPAESDDIAAGVASTDGVVYVPALLGLGTPHWDYGARGALFGITRGTTRAHTVRAVLEGIAHRGVDLVDAAEADTGISISGQWQSLADACSRIGGFRTVSPLGAPGVSRQQWGEAVSRAKAWIPDLSALDF